MFNDPVSELLSEDPVVDQLRNTLEAHRHGPKPATAPKHTRQRTYNFIQENGGTLEGPDSFPSSRRHSSIVPSSFNN